MIKNRFLRVLVLILGYLFFFLGLIGAFLPVIPTVPFWLLTGICFSKASPQLHQRLRSLPRGGQSICEWEDYRIIKRKTKVIVGILLALSIFNIVFISSVAWTLKLTAVVTILAVFIFICTRPETVQESIRRNLNKV